MKRFLLRPLYLMIALIGLLQITAEALFMMGEPVPVDRLITNVSEQYKQRPNNPATIYTLGRLHSLAFAQGSQSIPVYWDKTGGSVEKLPKFGPYSTPAVKPEGKLAQHKKEAMGHLRQSIQLYRRSLQLAPKDALYWFSYGWMLDQGAEFASEEDAPFLPKPHKVDKWDWKKEALKAYRKAYALSQDKDAQKTRILEGAETIVSVEAGNAILDQLGKLHYPTKDEAAEIKKIRVHLERLAKIPHAMTPIIFPLNGSQSLASLTATQARVRFNLSGDRTPHVWPWVTPQTGILVWDPKHTGRIASGRQLFGSVTWWIFWRNGYEPLAALDNNRDGVLTGPEISGIAVWQDKNSNGYSDTGEVMPVQKFGVRRIAVHPTGIREGVLSHPGGLVMQDGSTRPLYDWTPASLPVTAQ